MKKITLVAALLALIISSCSKRADDIVLPKATAQADVSNATAAETLYIWDQLPLDLKNAVLVNASYTDKYPAQSFGAYGSIAGTGFSSFPPTGSKIYAMGFNTDNSGLNKIIIWYKGTDNKINFYATGVASNFYIQRFADDEYISKISVYSGTIINKLTITTNKKAFTYGAAGGTLKSVYAPASQILGFWGYSSTNIAQLYIGAYVRTWTLLPGSDVRDIAVSTDGTAYITNNVGKIYKFVNNAWSQIAGSDGRTIAANAGRVVLVNTVGKIYEFFGNAWVQLPGSDAKDVAINSDGKIWMVNTAGKIYRYNETSWELMPALPTGALLGGSRIGAGANQVWVVNSNSQLFKWTGSSWQAQTGISANDLAVSSDGIVWIVKSGVVYNNYGGTWVSKGAFSGANIAANNKTAFLTQSIGSVRNLIYY